MNDSIVWALDVLRETKFGVSEIKPAQISANTKKKNLSNFEDLVKSRRSIRKWLDSEVDINLILKAIDCAQWAPSSCNRQSTFFLVLTKKEDFKHLIPLTNQTFFQNADKIVLAFVDMLNYNQEEHSYAFLDSGAAIQNLLLELHNLGFGACQFGIKQTKKNFDYSKLLLNRFGLPKTFVPVSFIAIGSYDSLPVTPGRKDIQEISKIF